MIGRVLQGARLPAAEQAFAFLNQHIQAVAGEGRLAVPAEVAAELIWSSVNAASLLFVTARLRGAQPPTSAVVKSFRKHALKAVFLPRQKKAAI